MRALRIIIPGVGLSSMLVGCAVSTPQVNRPFTPPNDRGIVFSVDGAGGFEAASDSLREAVEAERLHLAVQPFPWSHGYGRVLADEMDAGYARCRGQELAGWILNFRRRYPTAHVDLVGHSAGAAVILAATESLPPNSVSHIVLLAPSVSAGYDIRPALCAVACGVDVFYSRRDIGYLGVGVTVFGTSDGRWFAPAAGRVGFRETAAAPEDAALLTKLHQHPWTSYLEWTGNHGGHYDGYKTEFLRAYVVPLLAVP